MFFYSSTQPCRNRFKEKKKKLKWCSLVITIQHFFYLLGSQLSMLCLGVIFRVCIIFLFSLWIEQRVDLKKNKSTYIQKFRKRKHLHFYHLSCWYQGYDHFDRLNPLWCYLVPSIQSLDQIYSKVMPIVSLIF